jgi:uncharacterized membrane protein
MMQHTQYLLQRSARRWELSDNNSRSIAKAVSYRLFGSIVTFLIAFVLTGSLAISSAVGIADLFAKTILFYLHERIWNKIPWGRQR